MSGSIYLAGNESTFNFCLWVLRGKAAQVSPTHLHPVAVETRLAWVTADGALIGHLTNDSREHKLQIYCRKGEHSGMLKPNLLRAFIFPVLPLYAQHKI